MTRAWAVVLVAMALAAGCTNNAAPTRTPPSRSVSTSATPASSASPNGVEPWTFDVVAATGGADRTAPRGPTGDAQGYLEGMQLAVREANARGGVAGRPVVLRMFDTQGEDGRATALMNALLKRRPKPVAILYVGPGPALEPLQVPFAEAGTPVMLLQGDLYSAHRMFRQVFQTTIPFVWQVHVIARYLVKDRQDRRIVFVGSGPEARTAAAAARDAVAYWGGRLQAAFTLPSIRVGGAPIPAAEWSVVKQADAVIPFGPAFDTLELIGALRSSSSHPPRVAGPAALLSGRADRPFPPPGTSACYVDSFAGWAHPIKRVARFAGAFRKVIDGDPGAPAQEGFDAVMTLVHGLQTDGGRGGGFLTDALERIHGLVLSNFPVSFGPDDHLFLPRDQLGLFAVPGPNEQLDPWMASGEVWRPVMRTFTSDGTRDNIPELDKPVFFPRWHTPEPSPPFSDSRYGIVTGASDPLH